MPRKPASGDAGEQFFTAVSNEQYDELSQLEGMRVVYASVWEDSLVEALETGAMETEQPDTVQDEDVQAADLDLYLDEGIYFECYGVVCYPSLDADPLAPLGEIERTLAREVKRGLWLEEIAVDEDDSLVLVLTRNHRPLLYLQVGAWLLEEWEELPDSADS